MTEMNGKYVNEEIHQKGKRILKTAGFWCLGVALALVIVGLILIIVGATKKTPSMTSPGWFEAEDKKSGLIFGGVAMLMIGVVFVFVAITLFVRAHQREILAFGVSSVAPVAGEAINYAADAVSPAIEKVTHSVASGVSSGIAKGKASAQPQTEANSAETKFCTSCGKKNPKTAKFCGDCGHKFAE